MIRGRGFLMLRAETCQSHHMNGKRILRQTIGFLFWILVGIWIFHEATSTAKSQRSLLTKIQDHFTRESRDILVEFEAEVLLELGDPGFVEGRGNAEPVGEVVALLGKNDETVAASFARTKTARIELFDSRQPFLREDARLRLVVVPELAGSWAWNTLINDRTAPKIREIWNENSLLDQRDEIAERLVPIIEGLLTDCRTTIEEEMRPFVARHRDKLHTLLENAEKELGSGELAALFEKEIWPILHKKLDPVLDAIGSEIWERTPVWGFAWRAVYQSLPLTADDHFERKWDQFVTDEVIPVLKAHSADIVQVSREVAKETLNNAEVGAYLRKFLLALASDPEFHKLGYAFADEVFFKNPKFRERIRERWKSDEVQSLLSFVSSELEPTIRKIGDVVLGTKDSGITPEFARVLRAQVLEKDRQRLYLDPGSDERRKLTGDAKLPARIEIEVP